MTKRYAVGRPLPDPAVRSNFVRPNSGGLHVMIPRLAPKLSGSRDPALKARAGRRTSGPKAVVGADIRTAHECSLWSNTSMGTALLDPQRQYVTVTKCNAGRGGGETVGAGAGFEDLGGETEPRTVLGKYQYVPGGRMASREPAESSEEPGESGPCGEASRRGPIHLRVPRCSPGLDTGSRSTDKRHYVKSATR